MVNCPSKLNFERTVPVMCEQSRSKFCANRASRIVSGGTGFCANRPVAIPERLLIWCSHFPAKISVNISLTLIRQRTIQIRFRSMVVRILFEFTLMGSTLIL